MLMHSPTTKVGSYSFHLVLQYFIVSLDVHKGIYSIFQYNLTTHVTTTLVDASPGGASRPELSRDGRTLAFVRRVRDKQALVLKYVGNHLSSTRFSTFLF
jgi:Tol biopolymer transport system component